MMAIILAGGFATRLRPLSYTRPKALFPILGKPILGWNVEMLRRGGIEEIVISTRYLSGQVRQYVAANWDNVVVFEEEQPLGDGGPIWYIHEMAGLSPTFAVIYGDVYSDVDLREVVSFHERRGGAATLVVTPVGRDAVGRYGVVFTQEDKVTGFVEKPHTYPGSDLVNAGIYIFTRDIVDHFRPQSDGQSKISRDVLPELIRRYDVYAYVHRGQWFDIGSPEDYMRANFAALSMWCSDPCVVGGTVEGEVKGPAYIGAEVRVGRGSIVGPNVVLLDGVKVGENTRISSSVVFPGAVIGAGSHVRGAIIGEGAALGRWCRVEEGAVIADGVYVAGEVRIGKGVKVGPYREVSEDAPDGVTLP